MFLIWADGKIICFFHNKIYMYFLDLFFFFTAVGRLLIHQPFLLPTYSVTWLKLRQAKTYQKKTTQLLCLEWGVLWFSLHFVFPVIPCMKKLSCWAVLCPSQLSSKAKVCISVLQWCAWPILLHSKGRERIFVTLIEFFSLNSLTSWDVLVHHSFSCWTALA